MGMRGLLLTLVIVSLYGCAGHDESYVKQGKRGIHVSCSGLTSSWNKCEKRAFKACGGDYRVLARSGQDGEEATDLPFGINPAGFTSRSMIIMCK